MGQTNGTRGDRKVRSQEHSRAISGRSCPRLFGKDQELSGRSLDARDLTSVEVHERREGLPMVAGTAELI
jgi:hypothetical protein